MNITKLELVAGGVAVASFVCSAAHIYSVAVQMGNPPIIAGLHALGLDGLIYVGLASLKRARVAGWIAASYGAVMSLAFNGASYSGGVLPWPVMAATMPLAMILGFVVIHAGHKDKPAPVAVPAAPRPRRVPAVVSQDKPEVMSQPDVPMSQPSVSVPDKVSKPRGRAKDWDKDKATLLLSQGRDVSEIAELVGVSAKTITRLRTEIANRGVTE